MPYSLNVRNKIDVDSPIFGESNSEREKYQSLISILRGFEEYTLDRLGKIISTNLEAVTITGYEEWEVIGKHISIFYAHEDQLAGRPQQDLQKAEIRPLALTGLRMKKRNASFWAKVKLRPLFEDDTLVGYKMTLQDATHKAVSDHRVRGFRDEYLSLFNNSFVGIYKFSMTDYSVVMMNEKVEKLVGFSREDNVRLNFQEIFENASDFAHFIIALKSNKRVEEWEFKLRNQERWAMLSCRYFEQRNFVEGVIVDTTALRRSNAELDRLKNELDQFIYHASHELRSPIVSMLGIINLVSMEANREETLKLNEILKDKVIQLDELLKNITSIAYNNKSSVEPELIDFDSLTKSMLKELYPTGHPVQVFYNVDQRSEFANDLARIRTIMKNLISNSLKYYNPTVDRPWLNLKISVDINHVLINISDNGIGIERSYVDKIFNMFYKATEYPKGPGLGLYIVKAMTDKLEGRIHIDSVIGNGSTFQITIPNRAVLHPLR